MTRLFAFFIVLMGLQGAAFALEDPMRPPFMQEAASGNPVVRRAIRLSMIVKKDERRYAVVNGKTVTEGDRVDGYRVVRVRESSVSLSHNGRVYDAQLFNSARKNKINIVRHKLQRSAGEENE